MGDINRYFNREEFACNCHCGQDTVDAELLKVLTRLREYFASPLIISSGNRCNYYNKGVGGKLSSYHLTSKAADIVVEGVKAPRVQEVLEGWYDRQYGIGCYNHFTHIDVRPIKARW